MKDTLLLKHMTQVERLLGRSLREDEMIQRETLADLSAEQSSTARLLRIGSLTICAVYLKAITKTSGLRAVIDWMAEDELR